MRTMLRCVAMLGAAAMLAGCGGGGGGPKTRLQVLADGAVAVARKTYPKAFLFRADAVILSPPATGYSTVDGWTFILGKDPNDIWAGSLIVNYRDGKYVDPIEDDADCGDGIIRKPIAMEFDAAVARLKATGYSTEFDTAKFCRPIWSGGADPSFIFHVPAARAFIFVNTATGAVTSEPDHKNLANQIVDAANDAITDQYPVAELYTVTASVFWDGDEPYVSAFDLEYNNPGSKPVTTLVVQGFTPNSDFPDVDVQARQMTGYKPVTGNFVLDPPDAVDVLQKAGYTEHFTTTGYVHPSDLTQPLFFFTFPDRKVTVYVGGIDGVVSTKPL